MAVTLTGGTGLFDVLGRLGAWIRNINGLRGGTVPYLGSPAWGSGGAAIHDAGTAFANIVTAGAANKPFVDGIYAKLASFRVAVGTPLTDMQALAQAYTIAVVNADTPLSSLTVNAALNVLISQLKANAQTVRSNAPAATVTAAAGNVGTAKVICNVTGHDGLLREYIFPETLTLTALKDKNSGATAGSETLNVASVANISDRLSYLWPAGSGAAAGSVVLADPMLSQGKINVLNNSSFESFTANIPAGWVIVTGVAGTTVLKSTAVVHASYSTASLQITGTGSELTSLTQQFNSIVGTTVALAAQTSYPVAGWCKVSATPSAGVLKIDLIDGSGTVINDDQGTPNSLTIDLTLQTTGWAFFSVWFRTPTNLPSTIKLRLHLTTALDNTKSVYIDDMAMAANTIDLYKGGPLLAAFRGDTEIVRGDNWSDVLTNTNSAFYTVQTAGLFQTLFDVLFDMRNSGLILPSAVSPSISDTLVA